MIYTLEGTSQPPPSEKQLRRFSNFPPKNRRGVLQLRMFHVTGDPTALRRTAYAVDGCGSGPQ